MISTALVFEVGTATITIVTQSAIKWGKGTAVGVVVMIVMDDVGGVGIGYGDRRE